MKEDRKPIYGTGDKVKIVKYGHLIGGSNNDPSERSFPLIGVDGNIRWLDMSPHLVGQEGIISKAEMTQRIPGYAIEGIKGKHAWYDEEQMEMVNKNPNR
jgi:hypothetical protein